MQEIGVNVETNQPVAIKLEPGNCRVQQLQDEYRIYRLLGGAGRVFISTTVHLMTHVLSSFCSWISKCLLLWSQGWIQHYGHGSFGPQSR